jgi:hypothetical protein
MAEYKGIKGFKVQTVSTDPAASIIATGVWASGGDLNTTRYAGAGNGTQTASLAISGGGTPTITVNVEQYNGTSWTEVNNVNTGRTSAGGAGTVTAGLFFGGGTPTAVANNESWNGTSWTETTDLNSAVRYLGGNGTSTAALQVAGSTGADVEQWNGSSWTEVNDINNSRVTLASVGTTTASVAFGGREPTISAKTELWDGTNWTEVNDLNNARGELGGAGTSTSALAFGGSDQPTAGSFAYTESWDGTNWVEASDLATARSLIKGGGTSSSSALGFGGTTDGGSTQVNATEEWTTTPAPSFQQENLGQVFYNSTSNAFKVTQQSASAGTWASITPTNTPRRGAMGAGTETNGMVIAGFPAPNVNVEIYNGSSWTEVANINNSRGYGGTATNSPTTSAIIFGGDNRNPALPGFSSNVETWNGTSWTETTDLPTGVGG